MRSLLGECLKGFGVVVGLVTVGALLWDVVSLPAAAEAAVAAGGMVVAVVKGAAIRTALLGALAMFLWMRGQALTNPDRYGPEVLDRQQLAEIVERERTREVDPPTEVRGFYRHKSDASLVEVYTSIDPRVAPERFDELISEIRRRHAPSEDREAAERVA